MIPGRFAVCEAGRTILAGDPPARLRLEEPGQRWRMVDPPPEILLLVCAALRGLGDVVEIRLWGDQHMEFPRRVLPCARGLPAHGTRDDTGDVLDVASARTTSDPSSSRHHKRRRRPEPIPML